MKTSTFRKAARFGLLFTLALSAVLACSAQPGVARGTCGPTETDVSGVCQPCPPLFTPASITSANLGVVFRFAGIQNANYTVSNNVGTFNIAGTNLANFNFKAPPPAPISVPPVNGSTGGLVRKCDDLAVPGRRGSRRISRLREQRAEGDRHGEVCQRERRVGDDGSGRDVDVDLSGELRVDDDAAVAAGPVAPRELEIGDARVGRIRDREQPDWCNGVVSGPIESAVQSQLQSALASQFTSALNGQNNSSPFWLGFMSTLANQTVLSVLSDPAGYPLPKVNQATPGGTRPPGRLSPATSATPVAR